MHSFTSLILPLLLNAPSAHAWGIVGHATIATIANHYLTAAGKTYVSNKLGAGVTMASVASWADDYRYTTAGRFSAPYQFVPPPLPSQSNFNLHLSHNQLHRRRRHPPFLLQREPLPRLRQHRLRRIRHSKLHATRKRRAPLRRPHKRSPRIPHPLPRRHYATLTRRSRSRRRQRHSRYVGWPADEPARMLGYEDG